MYEKMFEPIKIRGLEMKNRVVYSAAGTKFSGKQGSFVTDKLIDYHCRSIQRTYAQRAQEFPVHFGGSLYAGA